jgi:uncharacterized membrane protein
VSPRREWTEQEVEQWVGGLLRAGVMIAAAVALVGGIFLLLRHGLEPTTHAVFRAQPGPLDTVGGVLAGVAALQARAIVQLGLLLLIATPIARVALSLVAFAHQRDGLYVAITAIVLTLLLYGLFGPGVG